MSVTCQYCGAPAKLITGAELYPRHTNPELQYRNFWECFPCDAHVGCHKPLDKRGGGKGDGTVPLGTLANAELRKARTAAHLSLDRMWKHGVMHRARMYQWLAQQMQMKPQDCHIGSMNIEQCRQVVQLVAEHYPQVAKMLTLPKTVV